jgi:hypothetical protein
LGKKRGVLIENGWGMRWKSLFHVGFDGGHEVEANAVGHGDSVGDAALVDSAGGDIGSGSGKAEAKSPAGLSNFLPTLISTLLEFVLTPRGGLALLVLIRAFCLNALDKFRRLGEDDHCEHENDKDSLHFDL